MYGSGLNFKGGVMQRLCGSGLNFKGTVQWIYGSGLNFKEGHGRMDGVRFEF